MRRLLSIFLLALLLSGCQATTTVTLLTPRAPMEKAHKVAVTFTNRWEGSIGPPELKEFGHIFLEDLKPLFHQRDVMLRSYYTSSGGLIDGRYFLQLIPVSNLGHRLNELCIQVTLDDDQQGLAPVWAAQIWVPALDEQERQSANKGWGTKSAEFLAHELVRNLEKIGLI